MRQEAFTDIFSPLFRGFTSRMYIDYLDENKSSFVTDDDYPTYLISNFKFLAPVSLSSPGLMPVILTIGTVPPTTVGN